MNKNSKSLHVLVALFIMILQTPILIKVVVNIFIVKDLLLVENLPQLLAMSELSMFNYELLFKLALVFSDFTINFQKFINALSLLDVLPILMIILLFEINRITKKEKSINVALFIILLIYILKYLGFFLVVMIILNQGLNVIIGLKYIAKWLSFIAISFLLSVIYLIWSYNKFIKNKDY